MISLFVSAVRKRLGALVLSPCAITEAVDEPAFGQITMRKISPSVFPLVAFAVVASLTTAFSQQNRNTNNAPATLNPATSGGFSTPSENSVAEQPRAATGNIAAFTNSIEALNDKVRLGPGDRLSFRIIEERKDPILLQVTDSGELDIPYIGRVLVAGKTCKEVAIEIKPALEKEYFYRATPIVGLETISQRSRGKVYIMGQVRAQGAMDIPPDETLTVSKAILRAGGLGDFANRRKIKLVRKKPQGGTETIYVDLAQVLDKGRADLDPTLQADDMIIVPERMFNF